MNEYSNELKINGIIPEDNTMKDTNGYLDNIEEKDIKKYRKKIKKLKKKKKDYGCLKKKEKIKYKKLKKKLKKLKNNNEMSNQSYCHQISSLKKQNEILKFMLMRKFEGSDKIFEDLFIKKISQEIENNFIDSTGEFID